MVSTFTKVRPCYMSKMLGKRGVLMTEQINKLFEQTKQVMELVDQVTKENDLLKKRVEFFEKYGVYSDAMKEIERLKSIITGIHNFAMAGYEEAENNSTEQAYDAVMMELHRLHRGDKE